MATAVARLLATHAALPEPYQPAWGLGASRSVARRDCDDRLAVVLPPLEALPCEGTVRILDLGCAQGYFTLAIAHALAERGRDFEIVGVDYLEDNIHFCEALAAHHGLSARFVHARVDAEFLRGMEGARRDVVLALNVLHHVQHQQGTATDVLDAIRAHSRVAFCELAQRGEALEWVGKWHAADDQLLGGYAFHRRLASFPTHLGDVRRPLYVCSDTQAWVGEHWFEFDRAAGRSHPGVPDAFADQRRFLFGRATIVKAYRGEGRYGAFNRAELESETAALAVLSDEPGRYPKVLGRSDDGDTVWLARGLLHGCLLSACIDVGERFDPAAVLRGLLGELAHLESRGFHHGDLRCWNVLVDKGRVRLIDFGALTGDSSPLHRIALAAVLLEIAEGRLRHEQPFYASLHPLAAYPETWRGLVRYLLETPQRTFRFALALEALDGAGQAATHLERGTRLAPATDVMVAAAQEQAAGFRRLLEHLTESERQLAVAGKESANAAAERVTLEGARREAEAHAISLAQALAESQRYAEALDARLVREAAEAGVQRKALESSESAAKAHAESLGRALDESRAFADSLKAALDESKEFVAALQVRIARETAEAEAERKSFEVATRESEAHAQSLAKALAESQAFADSLQVRIAREANDAREEREAVRVSQREGAAHAAALRRSLDESQTYARSLKEALEESRRYADSLHARLEREAADANREREQLVAGIAGWQARHARMQRRFRLLKLLWPHEPDDRKEPE